MGRTVTLPTTALVALVALVCQAHATVIHVPSDQPTIAEGIAAASPGDTVEVACDTYHESGLVIEKAITLQSETGLWDCVTIDGDAAGSVLHIRHADGAVVSGIRFIDGAALVGAGVRVDTSDVSFHRCRFEDNHATLEGGGLRYLDGTPQLSYCEFVDNTAVLSGGGMMLGETAGLLTHCDYTGNVARWGGGAAIYDQATTALSQCTFTDNHAVGDSYGGGLYCWNSSSPTLEWCNFYDNTSDDCGGGAAVDEDCSPTFFVCLFYGNEAEWGGGCYVWAAGGGQFTSSTFYDNTAVSGGGLAMEGVDAMYVGACWFKENTATVAGGGMLMDDCAVAVYTSAFVGNVAEYGGGLAIGESTTSMVAAECTFCRNRVTGARGLGAGLGVHGSSATSIVNSVIAFSTAGEAAATEESGPLTAIACVVYGNAGGDWVGCLAGQDAQNDNAHVDPLFCDMYDNDLGVCANSYCVETNNPPEVQIGAFGEDCEACDSAVEPCSWGGIKALYR